MARSRGQKSGFATRGSRLSEMGGGFLMPACQWFADKIAQAVQKIAQTVQFFIDASSGL